MVAGRRKRLRRCWMPSLGPPIYFSSLALSHRLNLQTVWWDRYKCKSFFCTDWMYGEIRMESPIWPGDPLFFHPDPAYSELYYCPWASSCERRRVRRWAHGRLSTLVKAIEGIEFFESSVNGQSLTGRWHGQLTDLDLPLRSVAGDKAIYFISFFFMSNDCRRILADTGELCT